MKKKLMGILSAFLLLVILSLPAMAADEYGAAYDEAEQTDTATLSYVTDAAYLLTDEEMTDLENKAESVSKEYGCGVYIITVDDYTEIRSDSSDGVFDTLADIYHAFDLGEGDDLDGIALLLSMEERDYAMFIYGAFANEAFTSYGQEQLEQEFLDDFAEDDWEDGFEDYLDACEYYLQMAKDGTPVEEPGASFLVSFGIALAIGCVIALVVCLILKWKMRSVFKKTEANAYVTAEGLNLTGSRDRFIHTTRSVRKIEKPSDGGGGSHSGGGGSGRSGKF